MPAMKDTDEGKYGKGMNVNSSSEKRCFVLAIASGKGGTGKTFVSTNLAAILANRGLNVTLIDCDVEAPDDHLFIKGSVEALTDVTVNVAHIDEEACSRCMACRDVCAFKALRLFGTTLVVIDELCHGCGLCATVCPVGAMALTVRRVGEVEITRCETSGLRLVTGRMDVGEVKAPAVIRAARSVDVSDSDIVILDAPPGVSCAMVAAVRGADAVLFVTEPTVFGIHDLSLSLQLGRDLGLPSGVIINRDSSEASEWTSDIIDLCADFESPVVGRIPFSRDIAAAYACGLLEGITDSFVRSVLLDAYREMKDQVAFA